jgi:tetratricopeptide (TPR) repeat protein
MILRPKGASLLAPLLAGLVAFSASRVDADDAEREARLHFRRGETSFAVGRFADALAEYQAAFELISLPGFLFNIGQCHRNLGNLAQAVFSFKKYLRLKPDAHNRAAVEELVADLERQIAAQAGVRPLRAPASAPSSAPAVDLARPPGPQSPARPLYSRWWFWTATVAALAGGVLGAYFATRPQNPAVPGSVLGNIDFR